MRFERHLISLVALGLGAVACSAADGSSPSTSTPGANEVASENQAVVSVPSGETPIVTQVKFGDGRTFRFIEAAPGALMMDETGPAGVTPTARRVNLDGLEPLDVLERIAPGATAPVKLLDADVRRADLMAKMKADGIKAVRPKFAAVPDEQISELAPSAVNGPVEKAIDDSLCPSTWFTSQLCYQCNDYDWKVCNTFRSGVNSYQRNDTTYGESVVCTYRGQTDYRVRVRPWYSWSTTLSVSVPEGNYHWSRTDKTLDFDYEFRGDGGTGGYHIAGYGFTDYQAHGYCPTGLIQ